MHALGLDIGTTTLSAIVVDASSGSVLASCTLPNNTFIKDQPWARIQDANEIWNKVQALVEDFTARYPDIQSIGLTGQMHGILYVDAAGYAVSPLITWQDQRGKLSHRDGQSYAELLSMQTGYSMSTGYGMTSHFYNQQNNMVPKSASKLCTIQDYIGMRLAHCTAPVMHASNAASIGLFNIEEGVFDVSALRRAGMEEALLPNVTGKTGLLGKTPCGMDVSIAIGDNQASFIGSVAHAENSVLVNMGTGGQVSALVKEYCTCEHFETRPCIDGRFLLVGFSLCGGSAYALLERFLREVAALAGASSAPLFEAMNRLAQAPCSCADPLLVSTLFAGTRKQPQARGSIQNIGVDNFTPQCLIQGVLHGMVDELYQPYLQIAKHMEKTPCVLVGS
ncbi:MAG: FGGY family carbohydrate kinase [Clostridia bacterium]